MKKRASNFELMRIILMSVIPVYHLLVYNLLLKPDYNSSVLISLIMCVGGAIPADYAFMALSSYFFLESDAKSVPKKFLSTFFLAVTLYIVRFVVVRGLFGFENQEYFMIDDFIMKGAWWYINVYLFMQLFYPIINNLICRIGEMQHLFILLILGILFLFSFIQNKMNFMSDLVAFLFVYFFMGYLRRTDYKRIVFIKTKKIHMLKSIVVCYSILFFVSYYVKAIHPYNEIDIVQYVISRYNVLACFMGIFIFFFFKDLSLPYNKSINWFAGSTVYVFLLHETVLAVFWYFGMCWFPIWGCGKKELLCWIGIYTIAAFLVAIIVRYIYEISIKKIWDIVIGWLDKQEILNRWGMWDAKKEDE